MDAYAAGTLSPVEVAKEALARVEEYDGELRSFIELGSNDHLSCAIDVAPAVPDLDCRQIFAIASGFIELRFGHDAPGTINEAPLRVQAHWSERL